MVPERGDRGLHGKMGDSEEERKWMGPEIMQETKTRFWQYFSEQCSHLEV